LTPDDLDPDWVIPFLVFIAAFAAGQELSQIMVPKRKLPWQHQPPKVSGAVFSIIIVALIVGGLLIARAFDVVAP
jgi:hypothetical protein